MANRAIPRELKLIRGTYRRDRDGPRDPGAGAPLEHLPPPPAHLGRYGARMWRKVVPGLQKSGMLREHHLVVLEPLCSAYELYRDAHRAVYFKEEGGKRVRRPLSEYLADRKSSELVEYRIMKAAFQDFRMYLLEFGLTPASAGKVPAARSEKPAQDPIEAMMKGRTRGA